MATIEKRNNKYRAKVVVKGKSKSRTFETIKEAKRWAKTAKADMLANPYQMQSITLKKAIERYKAECLIHNGHNRQRMMKIFLAFWEEALGEIPLASITTPMVSAARFKLVESGKKNSTVNRYVIALSAVLRVAMNEWELIQSNVTKRLKALKEGSGRTRYLNEDEIQRVIKYAEHCSNRNMYPIIMIALTTGARKSEINNLKWTDIDFANKHILLKDTKNGEQRLLPLTDRVVSILKEHSKVRKLNTQYLFPGKTDKPGELKRSFEYLKKRLNLNDICFHTLRHTAASFMAMSGIEILTIASILGHKSLQMTKRYSHLNNSHQAKAVDLVSKKMFK